MSGRPKKMKKTLQPLLLVLLICPVAVQASDGAIMAILQDRHTAFFIGINVLLTAWFYARFDRFAVAHGPEVLTTLGIFGCFWGIATALLDFDARNVSTSVPQLLQGVKTAFWASVSGVGGSLVLRARHRFHKDPIPMSDGASKAASIDDLVDAMRILQRSLTGAEEGSLLGQLKLMRQEQNDNLVKLRASFDSYAEKVAENGSKALIEALKSVIADFNNQITEQFGENFKHLNLAVEKLVIWQQQYKEELDKLQDTQKSVAQNLQQAATSLSFASERTAAFTEAASHLGTLLDTMAKQYHLIEQSQQSLSTVLVQMKDVTPQFSMKLDALAESMNRGVSKFQSDVSALLHNFGIQAQASHGEMKQLLAESMKRTQTEINGELVKSLEIVREGVLSLDQGLQEELTKSLETLGRQLASLSEKFVADYSPLTDRLRELVQIAAQDHMGRAHGAQ